MGKQKPKKAEIVRAKCEDVIKCTRQAFDIISGTDKGNFSGCNSLQRLEDVEGKVFSLLADLLGNPRLVEIFRETIYKAQGRKF